MLEVLRAQDALARAEKGDLEIAMNMNYLEARYLASIGQLSPAAVVILSNRLNQATP
ncbi:hypothetical protein D3C83_312010 [compost metagenome]